MPDNPFLSAAWIGGGPTPGFRCNVEYYAPSRKKILSFLDYQQYAHIVGLVRELARQEDPTHTSTVDVRPVEDFHEIRDKVGVLGRINVRVFFFFYKPTRTIVVIGAIKEGEQRPYPDGRLGSV